MQIIRLFVPLVIPLLLGAQTAAIDPSILMYLLSSDEPTCALPDITNDSGFSDTYPAADIEWPGSYSATTEQIAAYFNAARAADSTVGVALDMPSQSVWDAMSHNEKALYLLNRERYDRGLKPFDGFHDDVIGVAQQYAQTLYDNDAFGHYEDGTPWTRLDRVDTIRNNRDFFQYAENLYADAYTHAYTTEPVAKAIYAWMYDDSGSSWGHRDFILAKGLVENSGVASAEGVIGFGIYRGRDYAIWGEGNTYYSTIVVMNAFDPDSGWSHALTQTVSLCPDGL